MPIYFREPAMMNYFKSSLNFYFMWQDMWVRYFSRKGLHEVHLLVETLVMRDSEQKRYFLQQAYFFLTIIKANIYQSLLQARHYSKQSTHAVSFNPHTVFQSRKHYSCFTSSITSFIDEDTEARSLVELGFKLMESHSRIHAPNHYMFIIAAPENPIKTDAIKL